MSLRYDLPFAYIPRQFGAALALRVAQYNDAVDIADQNYGHMKDLEADLRFIPAADLQDRAVRYYGDFMAAAREIALFHGWCLKNISVLPRARKYIPNDAASATRAFNFDMLHDAQRLRCELDVLRDEIFETHVYARKLLTDDGLDVLREDKPSALFFFNRPAPLLQDFRDWVETSFFDAYTLPLNVYRRSPMVDRMIADELNSVVYCESLMQKIRTGALQNLFPGLSLDGTPPQDAQLSDIYKHVADHAATFTPSETARIIHLADAGAKGDGARARGAVRHGQAGRAPR